MYIFPEKTKEHQVNKRIMKQKILLAVLLISMHALSCKSRFTSTSDATGPRRHEFADSIPVKNTDHSLKDAEHTLDDPQKSLTETRDSANNTPIVTQADSASSIRD